MSTGKIELSVGAVKIADKYEILTEEEIHNIDDKIPELEERVIVIEDELEESVKFKVVGEGTTVPPINGGGSYTLPIATKTRLGGVKIGNNLSIDSNGVLSATLDNIATYIYPSNLLGQDNTQQLKDFFKMVKDNKKTCRIKFPSGVFKINLETILIESECPIELVGEYGGTVFEIYSNQISDGTRLEFNGINGLKVKDIVVTSSNPIPLRKNVYAEITFNNCTNVVVDGVISHRTNGVGMYFINRCENVEIKNCSIYDTKADGIHMNRACKNFKIHDNEIHDVEDDCIGFVSHAYEKYGACSGVRIYNNILRNSVITGSGICCDGSNDIEIYNNKILNHTLTGIRINPIKESNETSYAYPSNITIKNNTIYNTGNGTSGDRESITISQAKDVTITNNECNQAINGGIFVTGVSGFINIKNNTVKDIGGLGIWVLSSTIMGNEVKCIVKDNELLNIGGTGIKLDFTSLKADVCICKDNNCYNLSTQNTTGQYGIFVLNSKVAIAENNYTHSVNTITHRSFSNCEEVIRRNNLPIDNNDFVNIGTSKHLKSGSAAGGQNSDIIWNWNPASGVAFWVNVNGTWKPVKWANE